MSLRESLRRSTGWRNGCGRFCFRRCLMIRRGSGRGWNRGRWWSGYWRTACRCGWGCNCTNLCGTRQPRECEGKEVEEVEEVKEVKDPSAARLVLGCRKSFRGSMDMK